MQLVPKPLKDLYEAAKVWLWLAVIVAALLTIFFGLIFGSVTVAVIAIALCLAWFLFQLCLLRWKQIGTAQNILKSPTHQDDSKYFDAATGLRLAHRDGVIALVVLFLVICLEFFLLVYPGMYWWIFTSKPQQIQFDYFADYHPKDDEEPWKNAPFVESLITNLKDEGVGAKRPFRVALGTTIPLAHPSSPFHCSLQVDEGKYDVAGYAFRLHKDTRGAPSYQPIPVDYPKKHSFLFKVPACEKGDQILLVVRITSPDVDKFPPSLKEASVLAIVDSEK